MDAEQSTARCVSFFFFSSRRRHTRCSRDWSSDVCSSDLMPNSAAATSRVASGSTAGQPRSDSVQRGARKSGSAKSTSARKWITNHVRSELGTMGTSRLLDFQMWRTLHRVTARLFTSRSAMRPEMRKRWKIVAAVVLVLALAAAAALLPVGDHALGRELAQPVERQCEVAVAHDSAVVEGLAAVVLFEVGDAGFATDDAERSVTTLHARIEGSLARRHEPRGRYQGNRAGIERPHELRARHRLDASPRIHLERRPQPKRQVVDARHFCSDVSAAPPLLRSVPSPSSNYC